MNLITDLLGGNDEAWMATPGRPCASPIDDPAMIRDHADNWFPNVSGDQSSHAARLCDGCPVGIQCLTYALNNRLDEGIYGGTTPAQRSTIRRRTFRDNARQDVVA